MMTLKAVSTEQISALFAQAYNLLPLQARLINNGEFGAAGLVLQRFAGLLLAISTIGEREAWVAYVKRRMMDDEVFYKEALQDPTRF